LNCWIAKLKQIGYCSKHSCDCYPPITKWPGLQHRAFEGDWIRKWSGSSWKLGERSSQKWLSESWAWSRRGEQAEWGHIVHSDLTFHWLCNLYTFHSVVQLQYILQSSLVTSTLTSTLRNFESDSFQYSHFKLAYLIIEIRPDKHHFACLISSLAFENDVCRLCPGTVAMDISCTQCVAAMR